MSMVIKCTHCKTELESEEDVSGSTMTCPACDQDFEIPSAKKQIRIPSRKMSSSFPATTATAATSAASYSTASNHPLIEQRTVVTDLQIPFSTVFKIAFQIWIAMALLTLILIVGGMALGVFSGFATHLATK